VNTNNTAGLHVHLKQTAPIRLDAQFHCATGELIVLVGPSGSGKSTILRCIAGLTMPETGSVGFNETAWLDTNLGIHLPPQKRSVGIVFQHYALFPHLSALDNITVVLGEATRTRREERARELLALVNLHGLESRRPNELSGGQQQRVALARSLARDPDVLLLDEPFSAVDQITRRKLQLELARLRQQLEMPIVLVTHDLDEACILADRMCVLHHGQTLQAGTPVEVISRPDSDLVARLVGLTNLFEGEVIDHNSEPQITLLRWANHILECRHRPEFQPGETVSWIIPPQQVILHRRDRPSRGERENPIYGVIRDFVALGGDVSITMFVDDNPDLPLSLTLSSHVAYRNHLGVGEHIAVSLLAHGIHLMPKR
jgi:molybdate transport system ATP-binding protein